MEAELYDQRVKSRKKFVKTYPESSLIDQLDLAVPIRVGGETTKYKKNDDRWTFRSMTADVNLLKLYG